VSGVFFGAQADINRAQIRNRTHLFIISAVPLALLIFHVYYPSNLSVVRLPRLIAWLSYKLFRGRATEKTGYSFGRRIVDFLYKEGAA
jgi:hypothetical protein